MQRRLYYEKNSVGNAYHARGEQKYIQEAFDTNWVSPLGPNVDAFEREIAAYAGTSASAALSSGTAALHLSVILAGVKEDYM